MGTKKRALYGIGISVFLFFSFFFCAEEAFPGTASAQLPVLRVGISPLAEGYEVQDKEGIFYGQDTDYMIALGDYAGFRVEFVPMTWEEQVEALQQGRLDVLAGVLHQPDFDPYMDFSRLSTGFAYTSFYVKGGRQKLDEHISAGQPVRIGLLGSQPEDPWIQAYLQNEHIPYAISMYPDSRALKRGMELGEVDGAFSHFLIERNVDDRVANFHMQPEYFAVRKGNDALRERLDRAADRLAVNRPLFRAQLFERYHTQQGAPLLLSQEEREYLRLRKDSPVRAVVVARARPYAYIDEKGEVAGTVRQIAQIMEKDLGIRFSLLPAHDYDEAYEIIAQGGAEILLNSAEDYGHVAAKGLMLTEPYMRSYYTDVTRRGPLPKDPVIATFGGYVSRHLLPERYPEERTKSFSSPAACLQAVKDGEADITYLPADVAKYEMMLGDFPDLDVGGSVAFSYPISVAISVNANSLFLHIFDQEIAHIGPQAVRDIIATHNTKADTSRSLRSLLYAYPQRFMLGFSSIMFLILFFSYRIYHQRQTHFREVQKLLYEDAYTKTHNRRWFLQACEKALHGTEGSAGGGQAMVVLRLQRLEALRATYGTETCFGLFRHLSEKLEAEDGWVQIHALSTSQGQLYILTKPIASEALEKMVRAFLKRQEYIHVGDMSVHVPLSVGICYFTGNDRESPDAVGRVLGNAAVASLDARPIRFFDQALEKHVLLRSRMESEQQKALEREEFAVWYQPKYDLATHRCIGAEALVRWTSPELGFLPPGEFISLFESNGFITHLDFYMLEHVMRYQLAREQQKLPLVPISVNQSRLHMQERGYLKRMQQLVRTYRTNGEVSLELLESAFDFASVQQKEHAITVVQSLKEMGFTIDMDDFGSGYSDLSLLNALPLDVMKLDRSMLMASQGSSRMKSVLRHMIDLGHALGMTVICEGIETEEQEELLRSLGCEDGQGYLYSKPLPEEEFTEFLRTHL